MNATSRLIIWSVVVFLLFPGISNAKGGIYFKCISGVNEYLLSESDVGQVSYVNLKDGYVNFVYQEKGGQKKFYLSSVPMNGGGKPGLSLVTMVMIITFMK